MNYYDYRTYFQQLINNSNTIISNQNSIILFLSVLCFLFGIFIVYYFLRNMIKGG